MKKDNRKKLFNIAITTTLATGAVIAAAPGVSNAAATFKDVNGNTMHYSAITDLASRGIINGYPDGTFKPKSPVQRNHTASILANLLRLNTVNVTNPGFKDVTPNYPYYGAIAALKKAGIVNGYKDGTYGNNKPLTRGEMATLIVRAFDLAGAADTPFKDIDDSPYKEAIQILYANNVAKGTSSTTFNPKALVTRGEFASFVVRAEAARVVPVIPSPQEPTPTVPTEPTKPTEPTAEEVKAQFVGKLTDDINKINESDTIQFLSATVPVLTDDQYHIDIKIENPEVTVPEMVSNKDKLLPFLTDNLNLLSEIQIGDGAKIKITQDNRDEVLASLVEEMNFDFLNGTLGDLEGKEIELALWIEDGGNLPLEFDLDFQK
ncbi:S-layer homology domain-containing protein [Ureibacillus sinduriensis]|uniref:S-layer homology domain-containing protein n=1 Tax=Ureibacillus sinduriensis TaxID=561440 RepID=UPI00068DF9F4|nr:S-layer homology domain-containing protein [Ureibacillus sinduriensis]